MSVILTAANNVGAVSKGLYGSNFTLNVRELDTRDKTLHLESAQFELHFENISRGSNKLYVVHQDEEVELSITTGTYSDIDNLIAVIKKLERAGHGDVVFTYSRQTSRVSVSAPTGKRCVLKSDSLGVLLGVGEITKPYAIRGSHAFPYAVDLTKGRRLVFLYTDLIGPSIEYEDNSDSRVLKTFLVQTLNGVNNYVFSHADKRLMSSCHHSQ